MAEIDYNQRQSVCGTPNYISPEVLAQRGHSLWSEAWAIGCIFYFMLVGIPPFETESLGETYSRIRAGKFYFPSNVYITGYARQLIETLLTVNCQARMLPQKILSHRIFHRSQTPGTMRPRFSKSASNLLILGTEGNSIVDSGKGSVTPPHMTASSRMLAENSLSRYSSTADIASRGVHSRTDYNGNNVKMLYSDSPPLSDDCVVPIANNVRYTFAQSVEIYIDTLDSLLAADSRTNMLELREMPRDMLCILCWIDYRNAYGFGCTLNDGTRSLHFNDGSSISQRGELMGFLPKPSSALRDPYEWIDSDELACPANLREKRNLLAYTSNYMARELCSKLGDNLSDSRLEDSRDLTYVVSAHQKGEQIIMGLSNGTCQMNDKDTHSKYVFGIDECGGVTLTIFSQSDVSTSYSLHIGAGRKPLPSETGCLRKFRELLTTQHRLLARSNRSICSTDC
uniref:Polo kinase n=1 Tax=Steinernema glaseri TaxID=37863 RepID=A0A1I7ZNH8_9BILA